MSESDSVAKKIQDKRTRVQAKAAAHEKASKDRAEEISNLKMAYQAGQSSLIVDDVLKKARAFAAYHVKVAQDGVGARKTGYRLENGEDEVENVYFTAEQRVGHLDKAGGIQELIDYIERMSTVKLPEFNPELQQEVDDKLAEENDKAVLEQEEPAADPTITRVKGA